ncbi:lipase 3-like [Bradysia coprophila]|uniref:lipase 3-like n=1 Tax=Bradysia coprophila TaxID=38358 RepID=UPI00187D86F4|nr:lipase 3-like [Bradysia coprophila]
MDNSIVLLNFLIIVNYAAVTKPMDSVSDILSAEGYRNEVHSVTTFDKYILKLHRIPSDSISSKVVVILHGLGASSYAFVITGPGIPRKNSITFKLANHGCDVWLINVRGTDYSHHQHLLPTSSKYWQFSLDEIVKYDLPAIIDYVLMKTNQTFVHFVGHSQGTTVVMAMLSLFPRYNKKLKTLHLMAPSVYFTNAAPLLKTGVMFSEPLEVKKW